jgi:hypothetical protein
MPALLFCGKVNSIAVKPENGVYETRCSASLRLCSLHQTLDWAYSRSAIALVFRVPLQEKPFPG